MSDGTPQKNAEPTPTLHVEPVVTLRDAPMSLSEANAVLAATGHTETKAICPVCRIEGGCLKQPYEAPKEGAMPKPVQQVEVPKGPGIAVHHAPPVQVPEAGFVLHASKIAVQEGHNLVVYLKNSEFDSVVKCLHGQFFPYHLMTGILGALNRAVEGVVTENIQLGHNEMALSMSTKNRDDLVKILSIGAIDSTPHEILVELEKVITAKTGS